MAAQIYVEHGNEAEFSKYPFAGNALMADSTGRVLAPGFVVDAVLYPKGGGCRLVSTESDGTTCIVSVEYDGGKAHGSFTAGDIACELDDSDGFHVGTLVLGRDSFSYLSENGTRFFRDLPFCVTCQHPVGEYGVTSVSIDGGETKLRGDLSFSWQDESSSRVEAVVGTENGESTLRFDVVPSGGVLARGSNGIRTIYVCRQPGSRFGVLRRGENGERPYLYLTRDGFFKQNSLLDRNMICANKNQATADYDKRSSYDDCGAAEEKPASSKVQEQWQYRTGRVGFCYPSSGKLDWPYHLDGKDPIKTYLWRYMSGGLGGSHIDGGDSSSWNSQQLVVNADDADTSLVVKPMTTESQHDYELFKNLSESDRKAAYDKYAREKEEVLQRRPTYSELFGDGPGYWDLFGSYYLRGVSLFGFTRASSMASFFVEESVYVKSFVVVPHCVNVECRWYPTAAADELFHKNDTVKSAASIYLKADRYQDFYSYFFSESGTGHNPGSIGYLDSVKLGELCYRSGWSDGYWYTDDSFTAAGIEYDEGYYHDGVFYTDSAHTAGNEIVPRVSYAEKQHWVKDLATNKVYLWAYTSVEPEITKSEREKRIQNLRDELKTRYSSTGIDLTKNNLLYINRARDMFKHFGCKNWQVSKETNLGEEIRYLVGWGSGSEYWSGGNSYFTFTNDAGKEVYAPKWVIARYVWWKLHSSMTSSSEESDTPGETWMRYFIVPKERGLCFYVGDYFKGGVRENGREESQLGWDCYGIPRFFGRPATDVDGLENGHFSSRGLSQEALATMRSRLHLDYGGTYDPTNPDGAETADNIFDNPVFGTFNTETAKAGISLSRLESLVYDEFYDAQDGWENNHPFSEQKIIEPFQAPVTSNAVTYGVDGGDPYDYGGAYGTGPFEFRYGQVYIEDRGYPDIYDPDGQELERETLENKAMYFFKFDLTKSAGNSFNFDTTDMTTTDAVYDNPIHVSIEPSTDAPRTVDVENPGDVNEITTELRKLTNRSTIGNGISISIPGLL